MAPHAEEAGPEPYPGLTPQQSEVLRFERRSWSRSGAKDAAIAGELGLSSTRYLQVLNELLDCPAALAAEPMLVSRLRRLREVRRSTATPGDERR